MPVDDRSIVMYLKPGAPESRRKPGSHLMSYQWFTAEGNAYTDQLPIRFGVNHHFSFVIRDYTKSLTGPSLKVRFQPFPGDRDGSPFSAQETADLRNGVSPSYEAPEEDYKIWSFGPFTLIDTGVEFEFSLEIDDASNPQNVWFVDPQMIVEEEG